MTPKPKRSWTREESRRKCAEAHKNSRIWVNSMNTDEYKERQRVTKLGERNGMFGKKHSPEALEKIRAAAKRRSSDESWINGQRQRVWTAEQRRKHSIAMRSESVRLARRRSRLRQISNSNGIPSYNESACEFFNQLNAALGWNGKHALNGGEHSIVGYSADYYNQSENLVIEWDEERHFRGKKVREKDVIRQKHILDTGVKMYRIREKTGEVSKVDEHVEDYTYKLQEIINEYQDNKAKTAVYQH